MPMNRKDFEALASMIASQINRENGYPGLVQRPFTYGQINDIMDFCKERNADFDRKRFSDHITARVSKDSPVASAMVLEKRRAKTRDVQGTKHCQGTAGHADGSACHCFDTPTCSTGECKAPCCWEV